MHNKIIIYTINIKSLFLTLNYTNIFDKSLKK